MSDLHPTSEPPVEGKVTVETAGTWEYDGQVGVYEAGSPWTTVKMENGEERPHRTGLVALVYQNGPLIAAAPGLQKALRGLLDRHDMRGHVCPDCAEARAALALAGGADE